MDKQDRGTKKAYDKEMAQWKEDLAAARAQVSNFNLNVFISFSISFYEAVFSWFKLMSVELNCQCKKQIDS